MPKMNAQNTDSENSRPLHTATQPDQCGLKSSSRTTQAIASDNPENASKSGTPPDIKVPFPAGSL